MIMRFIKDLLLIFFFSYQIIAKLDNIDVICVTRHSGTVLDFKYFANRYSNEIFKINIKGNKKIIRKNRNINNTLTIILMII